jgi:hypothetical protein
MMQPTATSGGTFRPGFLVPNEGQAVAEGEVMEFAPATVWGHSPRPVWFLAAALAAGFGWWLWKRGR